MPNIVKENFDSIHQMIQVIESRSNNSVMSNQTSSNINDYDFTRTHSYNEAKELFQNGYTDILEKIKTGVAANLMKTQVEQRRRVKTSVIGYAPHVPNAILNLPNSMILTEATPQKTKVVSIVYAITQNCGTNAQEFIDSGIAVLGVINSLELQGIRVNLKIAFYTANQGNEYSFGTVKVKDYREHIDIQKLCFPIAHPSMFRRLGFKWLETVPGIKESGWAWGYGHTITEFNNEVIKQQILDEKDIYMNLEFTKKYKYDVDKIIDKICK